MEANVPSPLYVDVHPYILGAFRRVVRMRFSHGNRCGNLGADALVADQPHNRTTFADPSLVNVFLRALVRESRLPSADAWPIIDARCAISKTAYG